MSFVLPIYLLLQSNEPIDSHRWINKANYKLVACRHLHFAFQWAMPALVRIAYTYIRMSCACFYLYLIIINCIQTSLLWDANKETQRATSSVSKCSDLCLTLRQSWFLNFHLASVVDVEHRPCKFQCSILWLCARIIGFFFLVWKVVRWLSHMYM